MNVADGSSSADDGEVRMPGELSVEAKGEVYCSINEIIHDLVFSFSLVDSGQNEDALTHLQECGQNLDIIIARLHAAKHGAAQ